MRITSLLVCMLLVLLQLQAKAQQDTTMARILAAKDDSAKVVDLANYAWKLVETDTKKSMALYRELLKLGEKLDYPYWQGIAWLNMGVIHANSGEDKKAIADFKTAIPLFKKDNDTSSVVMCLLNLGAVSERIGDMDTRINATMQAIRILENTNDKPMLAQANNAMGVMYYNLSKFEKGIAYFKKGVAVAREAQDTTKLINGLYGMANCLSSLDQFPEALTYSREALSVAQASGKLRNLVVAHTSMTEVYIKTKEAKPILYHAAQTLKHALASEDNHYVLISYINLAEGHKLAGNQQQRLFYLNKALELGQKQGTTIQLDDVYQGLSDAYAKLNRHKEALEFYQKYVIFKDSTNNLEDKKNVAELEIKFQTAQKEKALSESQLKIAKQDLQLQQTKSFVIYSVAATLVALLVAGMVYLNLRHKRKLYARQLQTMQQEKEIQLLHAVMQGEEGERSRISRSLHDGVAGMLAAVKMHMSSLSVANPEVSAATGYKQAIYLLDEASDEVRKTAHNLMPEVLLHYGLDEALRRYCQSIMNKDMLEVQYDSWGDIKRYSSGFELSVYRIVQELLNNIIKHSKATHAIVQMSQQENILSITVEDNGVGISNKNASSDGLGLLTLRSRVEAIHGKMEVDAEAGSGVSAYLEFNTAMLEKELA
ncbi:tetratricopeptide repeat-containing sensor histidine kinase [Botryobacter ruber]|uniref:tetratricopeptide repeat-containing sensor histidine kinase n=1 Tax=Botryobacter ruber TaxID=2171629 RepID=UPI0013E405D2|nr:sensor histidine kinase [Botryobacter ruber]